MTEQTSRLAVIIDSTGAEKNADNLTTALSGLTEWGQKAAASAGKVTKASKEESAALSDLLDRIDPVNAALNKLDKQQQDLAKFKAKGFIDTETFNDYSKKIEDARGRLNGFSDQLTRVGMTSKQTAAAMRMVPAQMTDIVVSLASGQAPLTVLLQQGGQLKDMFGGIGPAAKALGTYIMGLVNPYTLAAAAIGGFGYLVYSNSQEIAAATKIVEDSLGRTGDSAKVLALNIREIASASNESVDDIAKLFITTKDGASDAAEKLIAVGFSYSDAKKMADDYKNSSNFTGLNADIETHRLKVLGIPTAWNEASAKVREYYTAASAGRQSVALGGAIDPLVATLERAGVLRKDLTKATIDGNQATRENVDWINKEYLATDRVAGAEDRLKQARDRARKIAFSGDTEAISNANALIAAREKELAAAQKQADKQPKTPKEKAYSEDAATKLLDQINQQTSSLNVQLQTSDKLSSVTQQRIKFEQQIADIKNKSQLTADQKSLLSRSDDIIQAYKVQEALQSQVTTLDDYRKMQEQVKQSDVQTNDLLIERLKLLDKAKAAGATGTDATRSDVLRNTKNTLPSSVTSVTGGLTPKNGELSGSWSGMQQQSQQLQQAQQALELWQQQQLASYELYYQNRKDLTSEYEQQISVVRQQYAQQSQALSAQQYLIQTTAIQSTMDSLVSITKDGFGEQSAIYKVAFAANKAYAIAQSLVSIQQGIAMAAANPFPANLVAMASVAAASASIVSNISAVAGVGFQSGGYTGNGGVSSVAGVVHGKEYVFDAAATKNIGVSNLESIRKNGLDATLSKSGFGTGAQNVSSGSSSSTINHVTLNTPPVTINGNPSDATIQLVQQAAKDGASQGYKQVASDLATGRGDVHKGLTSGYNTRRRAG